MTGGVADIRGELGIEHRSSWLLIDQPMIDMFAEATADRQFIHVDPERAAKTPFGGTIAHGFFTVSLLSRMFWESGCFDVAGFAMQVNYGMDRLRFVHPVRSGSRIRGSFTLSSLVEKQPGRFQQVHDVAVEIENCDKPALVAAWITQFVI